MLTAQDFLAQKIDFNVQNISIKEAILKLSEIAEINVSFASRLKNIDKKISVQFEQNSIRDILNHCLTDSQIRYKVQGNGLVFLKKQLKKYSISGYVIDAQSGERLIGAHIIDLLSGKGIASNEYGFFSLTLLEGNYHLSISYLGYNLFQNKGTLEKNLPLKIELKPNLTLQEVVVTPGSILEPDNNKQALFYRSNQAAGITIPTKAVTQTPSLGGESDIIRATYQLAGITTGADGLGGMHVRGGEVDQNLILFDGVPVYNPSHTLGLFSIFNTDAIKQTTFHKQGFSARYGGRLSSVLDVRTKEGNLNDYEGGLSIGTFASKINIEGPLQKQKSSFLLSFRRTHLDKFIFNQTDRSKAGEGEGGGINYYFYDFNGKLQFQLSERDRIYFSFYKGADDFKDNGSYFWEDEDYIVDESSLVTNKWGNTISAFRWNHQFNPKLFSNTTLTYSQFNYDSFNAYEQIYVELEELEEDEEIEDFEDEDYYVYTDSEFINFRSNITEWAAKLDFDYVPIPNHFIKFGGHLNYRIFKPLIYSYDFDLDEEDYDYDDYEDIVEGFEESYTIDALETSSYIEDLWQISDKLNLNIGLNFSTFRSEDNTFLSLQPRLFVKYKLTPQTTLFGTVSKMNQFIHLLSTFGAGFPNDLWVPATDNFKPQNAWQFAGGIYQRLSDNWRLDLELYHKQMNNLVAYAENVDFTSIDDNEDNFWEYEIVSGRGKSNGVEVGILGSFHSSNLHFNYTWSKSDRVFDGINQGIAFPFSFDRPHTLKFNYIRNINPNLSISIGGLWSKGRPITLLSSELAINPIDQITDATVISKNTNDYRLPDNHRVDINMNWKKPTKWGGHNLSIGIYNIYNRRNIVYQYNEIIDNNNTSTESIRLLPILPSFSYRIYFK